MPERKKKPSIKRAKRKFRFYYKTQHRHPAVIVEETSTEAFGYAVTHSPKSGNSSNLPLSKNPRKGDSGQSYLNKQRKKGRIGQDWSSFYLEGYELSDRDEAMVDSLEEKKKARTLVADGQTYSRADKTIRQSAKKGKKKGNRRKGGRHA